MVCLSLLIAGCLPLGPLPGGRLSGTPTPPPPDWASVPDYRTVQLETRPSDPYSINVWGFGSGPYFYIACRPTSGWLPYIQADPNVRLRIHDAVYELRAQRTESPADFDRYVDAMKARYDWAPSDEDRATAWLLRLEPRGSSARDR